MTRGTLLWIPWSSRASHNWSSSADVRNDENTLIIHNETLANIYYQEFSERFKNGEIIGHTFIANQEPMGRPELLIYPNPNTGRFLLVSPFLMEVRADLEIYTGDGRLIWSERTWLVPGENTIHLSRKPEPGLYILLLRHEGGSERGLFISQ